MAVHTFVLEPNGALTTLLLETLSPERRAYLPREGFAWSPVGRQLRGPGAGLSSYHVYYEAGMSLLWTLSTQVSSCDSRNCTQRSR